MEKILKALELICRRLNCSGVRWVVGGSASLALQGVEVLPEDIDIITDMEGAYRMQEILGDFIVEPVRFSSNEVFSSHYGVFEVEGVRVEVMGELRIRAGSEWVNLSKRLENPLYVNILDLMVPVSRLEDHLRSYRLLNRPKDREKIQKILKALERKNHSSR